MRVSKDNSIRVLLVGWLFVNFGGFSLNIRARDIAPKVDEYMDAAVRVHRLSGVVLLRATVAPSSNAATAWQISSEHFTEQVPHRLND